MRALQIWIAQSPMRAVVIAVVAVAAVGVGVTFALVTAGVREPATGLDPSASAAISASAAESASVIAFPSHTSTPSATAAESAEESVDASVEESVDASVEPSRSASPTPTATPPEGGFGGGYGPPTYDIEGTWTRLADMPGTHLRTVQSMWLPDGRIVVFRYGGNEENEPPAVLYDPEADSWNPVQFVGAEPNLGTDHPLALSADGRRVYAQDFVIDISGDSWQMTPFDIMPETDLWTGCNLAGGADGRIYRWAESFGSSQTELVAYDPADDSFDRISATPGDFCLVYAGPDDDLFMLAGGNGVAGPQTTLQIVRYDPVADSWSDVVSVPGPWVDPWHAALGPDDAIYVPGPYAFTELWAIPVAGGSFLSVEPPEWTTVWDADLLWSPDGELYLIGNNEVWRFTPEP